MKAKRNFVRYCTSLYNKFHNRRNDIKKHLQIVHKTVINANSILQYERRLVGYPESCRTTKAHADYLNAARVRPRLFRGMLTWPDTLFLAFALPACMSRDKAVYLRASETNSISLKSLEKCFRFYH